VAWDPQRREGSEVSWGDALRSGGWIASAGALWAFVTWAISPGFLLWLSPILAGLLLAVPMIRWSARSMPLSSGGGHGLWVTPAESPGQDRGEDRPVYQPTAAAPQDVSSA
jgi:membrane glycosyltransferase